jgi:phosphoglycolate phosphatase-like HAD superfamily hydrolase
MRSPDTQAFLHDAVLFDLDGTLVATDRFWIAAARTGCRAAFERLGLQREPPSAQAWMSLVGHPFEKGLALLFPDLDADARAVIGEACMREEARSLAAGGAALMPGALELLLALRNAGVFLGIASNCAGRYLEHMLEELGLGALVDEARCLDSPGVRNKADMISDLLGCAGSEAAVFVGDRESDRDAAWANGIAHVHCRFGFAPAGESTAADALIEDLLALPAVLARRRTWIETALEAAGALRLLGVADRPLAIGITGPPAVGKGRFARDAARVFGANGVPAAVARLAEPRPTPGGGERATGAALLADLARLDAEVFGPLASGRLPATEGPKEAADVLLVFGPRLLDPALRQRLDLALYLQAPEEVLARRAAGRARRLASPEDALGRHRELVLAEERFSARYPPERHADLVLPAANPLGLEETLPRR